MTKDGGRRIATANGAILADAARLGGLLESAGDAIFDPNFWSAPSQRSAVSAGRGRGAAWFLESGAHRWVLRHYRRGGFMARISADRYLWTGERRVRAFTEYRLLARLMDLGLPVPRPLAARYRRAGWSYRCDLITQRIEGAQPLSARLAACALGEAIWRDVGSLIARLHRAGVDHADLNAHNILLDGEGTISVIDFDRGRMRAPGRWPMRNLRRLNRSLAKISRDLPPDRFSPRDWEWLLAGYASAAGP
jgi:3-deoxy-D-manno-octulosonic acid kinase